MQKRARILLAWVASAGFLILLLLLTSINQSQSLRPKRDQLAPPEGMQSKAKFKPESEPPAPEWITLRGMVTDGDTGLPLAGAVVSGTTTEGTTYKTKASDLGEYKVLLDKA